MKNFLWLALTVAFVLSGCSLRYDFTECTEQSDCSRLENPAAGDFFACNTETSTCEALNIECRDDSHCGGGQICEQNACMIADAGDADSTTDADGGSDMDATDAADMEDTGIAFPDVDPQQDHSGCSFPPQDDGCETGPFGPGSFINELKIVKDRDCCRDFDGDGNMDNGLALIVTTAEATLNQDINPNIAQSINRGDSVTLLEYEYWTQRENDPAILVNAYSGVDSDDDYSDNLAGLGDFLVSPEYLDSEDEPIYQFDQATVVDETVYAVGDRYPFQFLLAPALLDIDVRDVQFAGTIGNTPPSFSLEAGGAVEVDDGLITGVVKIEDFYAAANDYTKNGCDCIGQEIFIRESEGVWRCTVGDIDPAPQCTVEDDGSFCQVIADGGQCDLLVNFIGNNLDHDYDGNGTNDSLSLALEFEAVGTSLIGIDDGSGSN
jgi:hypothetical protein